MNKIQIKRLISSHLILEGHTNKEIIEKIKNLIGSGISMTTLTEIREEKIIPITPADLEIKINEYKIQNKNKKSNKKIKKSIIPGEKIKNTRIREKTTITGEEIKLLVKSLIKTTRARAITEKESLEIYDLIKKLEMK